MAHIVSAERAISEGTTPEQTIMVSEWHEHRARVIAKVLKDDRPGKKKAFGDVVTEADRKRHLEVAEQLRGLASEIQALLLSKAA